MQLGPEREEKTATFIVKCILFAVELCGIFFGIVRLTGSVHPGGGITQRGEIADGGCGCNCATERTGLGCEGGLHRKAADIGKDLRPDRRTRCAACETDSARRARIAAQV